MVSTKIRPDVVILVVALPVAVIATCAIIRKHEAADFEDRCAELIDRTHVQVTIGGAKRPARLHDQDINMLGDCAEIPRFRRQAERAIFRQLEVATDEVHEAEREFDEDDLEAGEESTAPSTASARPAEPEATEEGLERRARSEARLKAEGVPINPDLPTIETSNEVTVRSQKEVVDRTVALTIVALKGEGLAQADVQRGIARFEAQRFFSPKEQAFIEDTDPSRSDRLQFTWRYECVNVMLWALGFGSELSAPDHEVDARFVTEITATMGPTRFRERARLRTVKELLDEADLICRYNWACVDARLKGETLDGINCEVVAERHHALTWLIGYQEQACDNVSTGT